MRQSHQVAFLVTGLFLGACRESAQSSPSEMTLSPSVHDDGRHRDMAVRLQLREPFEGLPEADLFREYSAALSEKRRELILGELMRFGSLAAADKLDALAAEADTSWTRFTLRDSSAHIRSRILQTREARLEKIRVSMMRIAGDSFSPASRSAVETAAKEGLVELRDEVHDVAAFEDYREAREAARQALVVLDLWAVGRTAEETFVLAVERGDVRLKEWALLQLKALPAISPASLKRVNVAMSSLLVDAERRAKRFIPTPPDDIAMGLPAQGIYTENTVDDRRIQCALRVFWEKHDPAALVGFERGTIWWDPISCRDQRGE